MMGTIQMGPYTIESTHESKVIYPDIGVTKGEVIDYYRSAADTAVPHMRDRPLTMHRFPEGINGEDFYQKETPEHFPEWIKRVKIPKRENGSNMQIVCSNAATLIYVVNQGSITNHVWLSRIDDLDCPDKLVFDLDPPPRGGQRAIRAAALALRECIDSLGLYPLVMTTGSRGMHVVVPLRREFDFDHVRSFARTVAQTIVNDHPQDFTIEHRKDKRKGRLFLDYLRNAYAQTSVAPYSLRAIKGAPVAAPVHWDEVEDASVDPQTFSIDTILKRIEDEGDIWSGIGRHARSLKSAQKELDVKCRDGVGG